MSVCSGHAVCKMSRKIHCRVLEKERETLRAGTEEAVRPHCIARLNKTVCYLSSFFSGNECLLRPRRLQKFPEKFTVGFSRKSVKLSETAPKKLYGRTASHPQQNRLL